MNQRCIYGCFLVNTPLLAVAEEKMGTHIGYNQKVHNWFVWGVIPDFFSTMSK
uniref:Uncharacterized protein n=1 Tax=Arundo donax TaxID=35708 RepID=A0A0A9BK08_ARUDO